MAARGNRSALRGIAATPGRPAVRLAGAAALPLPFEAKTRGGEANAGRILDCALIVFAREGFAGARIDAIAELAGLSKPNLLYYFRSKADLYLAVLKRTLDMWLVPLRSIEAGDEPVTALSGYVARKLEYARDYPEASRLFAIEVMRGAPVLNQILAGELKELVERKVELIARWMAEGRLPRREPHHLLFLIWAATQHYADFSAQVSALTGRTLADPDFFAQARESVLMAVLGEQKLAPSLSRKAGEVVEGKARDR